MMTRNTPKIMSKNMFRRFLLRSQHQAHEARTMILLQNSIAITILRTYVTVICQQRGVPTETPTPILYSLSVLPKGSVFRA